MKRSLYLAFLISTVGPLVTAEPRIESTASADSIACYDFVEVTVRITGSTAAVPCTDAAVTGTFGPSGGATFAVEGFCDADDGSVFRIRFMPTEPGSHDYAIAYRESGFTRTLTGRFDATDGGRRGLVRADPVYSGHFQWTGSKERFFWNGLESDGLTGLDDAGMQSILEHLDRNRITGLRIALALPTGGLRSDLAAWLPLERLITLARARDMVVAVVLPAEHDTTSAPIEPRRIRDATARLAAFSNVIFGSASASQPIDPALAARDRCGRAAAGFAEVLPLETELRTAWQHALGGRYSTLRANLDPTGASDTAVAGLLEGRGHLFDLFTGITWWELRAEDGLVVSHQSKAPGAATFAARNAEGDLAVIYVHGGGVVTVKDELLKDQLKPLWFSPRDGGMRNARALTSRVYRTPTADDWVLLFRTPCNCSFRDFDNEYER